jgi:hypothetical protein
VSQLAVGRLGEGTDHAFHALDRTSDARVDLAMIGAACACSENYITVSRARTSGINCLLSGPIGVSFSTAGVGVENGHGSSRVTDRN